MLRLVSIVLTSIIIAGLDETEHAAPFLDRLNKQAGDFEIIVVGAGDSTLVSGNDRLKLIPKIQPDYAAQLRTGAQAAQGDVLLFLSPTHQLPAEALLVIERNFELLPQTIGGNFHLKFRETSVLTRFLTSLLKRRRYHGCYFFNSGIFIRTEVYKTIGGLRPEAILADLDLVRRMEKYGPTLYLPQKIIAPVPSLKQAVLWLAAPILMR